MTFNDLRYIVVIAEENSITKAADKLYMTQPALSQYLKKVEKELGVLIFERTTTGVRPTAEGVQFLAFAKNVLNQEQDMKKQLQNLRGGDVGEVRLGFTGTQATYVLPHILPDFHLKYPGIEITLVEGSSIDIENKLLKHEVDIGFLHPPIMEPELEWFEFSRDEMVIIPREDSDYQRYVYWKDGKGPYLDMEFLRNEPLTLTYPSMRSRMICDQIFQKAGITPTVKLTTKRLNVLDAMAQVGFTSTIMPYKQLSAELKTHRRYYIDPKYSVPYSFVAAVRKNAYIPRVVQRLIEELHLKEYTF